MSYTLAAAAAATGLNKTTILRAIKAGKVSATKDEHGEWHIEPAECHRVYPLAAERTDAAQRYAAPDATALAEANARASLAEQRLSDLKAMLDDMKAQRDKWQEVASRLSLPKPIEPEQPMTLWRWLRSAG